MIKCPNADCGYENVDGTQFCEGCGEELPQAGGAAASVAPAIGGDMVKCPACDNLNPAENVVCEVCGTELQSAAAGAASPAPLTSVPDLLSGVAQATTPATVGGGGASIGAASPDASPVTATTTGAPDTVPDVTVSGVSGDDSSNVVISSPATSNVTPDPGMAAAASPAIDTASPDAGVVTPDVAGVADTSTSLPPIDPGFATADPTAAPIGGSAPIASTPVAGGVLEPGRVKLTVEQGMTIGKQFVLGDPEVQVGREDEEEGIFPDIDLSDQDEGFVHRQHATFRFADDGLTVEHLGGANKTRVNNRPIPDNQPQPVNMGDKISFGKVVLRVGAL
jgi:hypothetical protein